MNDFWDISGIGVDKPHNIMYNTGTMIILNITKMKSNYPNPIPYAIIQEAENMSHVTHLSFRDCLEIILKLDSEEQDRVRGLSKGKE